MKKKVLICTTLAITVKSFLLPSIQLLQAMGCEVHVACNGQDPDVVASADACFSIPFQRTPFSMQNVEACRALKELFAGNHYAMAHFHTPVASSFGRMAARQARKKAGMRVLYTAHGFHFYHGAKPANWLCYYPVEKLLAHVTDCLITINTEDYDRARRKLHAGECRMVHGVGVDAARFAPLLQSEKKRRREQLGYASETFLMIYPAEFNKNKNQQLLLHALAQLQAAGKKPRLLLAGVGEMQQECKALAARLGVEHQVEFLGFRRDLDQLLPLCDLAVASSMREGLPVNLMEAMLCGLPVVASDNRGHRELITQGETGCLVACDDVCGMSRCIREYMLDEKLRLLHGQNALARMKERYTLDHVGQELSELYSKYL